MAEGNMSQEIRDPQFQMMIAGLISKMNYTQYLAMFWSREVLRRMRDAKKRGCNDTEVNDDPSVIEAEGMAAALDAEFWYLSELISYRRQQYKIRTDKDR